MSVCVCVCLLKNVPIPGRRRQDVLEERRASNSEAKRGTSHLSDAVN